MALRSNIIPCVVALCLCATPAVAEIPANLQPTTHRWFANFGLGPAVGVRPAGTQFKLSQEVGLHLRRGALGPAVGVAVDEVSGNGVFRLQLGPKVWWDFQPLPRLGLYIAPQARLGLALFVPKGADTAAAFNLQLGVEGKLVLRRRAFLFCRPLSFDFFFGDFGADGGGRSFALAYDLMFGGGIVFW